VTVAPTPPTRNGPAGQWRATRALGGPPAGDLPSPFLGLLPSTMVTALAMSVSSVSVIANRLLRRDARN
jgi:hypothetical protein